jgi:hypothetical protein
VDTIIDNTDYYNNPYTVVNWWKKEPIRIDTISIVETEDYYNVEDISHKIKLIKEEYDTGIRCVLLSNDKKFVAIEIGRHEGLDTAIINLETWNYWFIKGNFEDVGDPRWSPRDNKLIVLIGSIMKLTPALYNVETKEIEKYLYDNAINLMGIKISNDGSFVDFVEENNDYGEQKYIIYRSYIDKEKVEELGEITRDKMIDWSLKWKR